MSHCPQSLGLSGSSQQNVVSWRGVSQQCLRKHLLRKCYIHGPWELQNHYLRRLNCWSVVSFKITGVTSFPQFVIWALDQVQWQIRSEGRPAMICTVLWFFCLEQLHMGWVVWTPWWCHSVSSAPCCTVPSWMPHGVAEAVWWDFEVTVCAEHVGHFLQASKVPWNMYLNNFLHFPSVEPLTHVMCCLLQRRRQRYRTEEPVDVTYSTWGKESANHTKYEIYVVVR